MTGIPVGWRWTTVGEAGRVDLGRQRHPDWHTGPEMRPYLRVANVFEDRIDVSDLKQMDFSGGAFDRYRLTPGDVLLNEGQSPEWLGRPAIYKGVPEEVAFTNTLLRFRAKEDVLPEWALTVFRHYMHSGRFAREARITTNIAHLSATRLKPIEFPVPPLEEQRRIVAILEDHLSRLDAASEYLSASRRRLDRLADGLLAGEYVTGEEPHADSPPRLDGLDDSTLPALRSSWAWRRLGDIADVVGGVTKDVKKQGDPTFVEVPYLRVANVQRGRLDLTTVASLRVAATAAEALRLQPGDVLLNEGGDRDKLGRGWVWEGQIEDCIHQNHVFRARVRDGAILPELLSHAANTIGGRWCQRNGTQSTNLASISLRKIKAMPVPVPPFDEQHAIAARIAQRRAACAQLEASLVAAERRQQALRRSLLSAAFSGQLTGHASDMDRVEELAGV